MILFSDTGYHPVASNEEKDHDPPRVQDHVRPVHRRDLPRRRPLPGGQRHGRVRHADRARLRPGDRQERHRRPAGARGRRPRRGRDQAGRGDRGAGPSGQDPRAGRRARSRLLRTSLSASPPMERARACHPDTHRRPSVGGLFPY